MIENCKKRGIVSSEEMNPNFIVFMNSVTIDPQMLEMPTHEAAECIVSEPVAKPRVLISDPYVQAKCAWVAGINVVKAAGYPNTAMYVKHA